MEAVRIEWTQNTLVQNCVIKNIRGVAATEANNNKSGIKMYHNKNTMIENCEIFNCTVGIYDKSDGESSTYRNNYIHDSFLYGIYVTSLRSGENVYNHPDVNAYNNVIANSREFSYYEESTSDSKADRTTLCNNTFYNGNGPGSCIQMFGGIEKKFYNNIIRSKRLNYGVLKFFVPTSDLSVPVTIAECDYNQYGSLDFLIRTRKNISVTSTHNYYTLADWQNSSELDSGDGHPDVNSLASDPMFENASGTMLKLDDFRLAQGSLCLGAGKNGLDMGSDIDLVGPDLPDYTRHTVVFYSDEYIANNNSYQSAIIEDVEYGSLLTAPADPVKVGYIFAGWYTGRDLTTEWDFANDPVESNMSLFARWAVETESVTISDDNITMGTGDTRTLMATVLPENAANKDLEWESSNTSVAAVDANGTVTAVSEGSATITVRVVGTDTVIEDTCTVTVVSVIVPLATLTGPVITDEQYKLTYGLEGAVGITAQDVTVSYDINMFDFVSVSPVSNGITIVTVPVINADEGTVRFILASLGTENAVNGNAGILDMFFSPKASGAGVIAVTNVQLANSGGEEDIYAETAGAVKTIVISDNREALASAIQAAQKIYSNAVEGIQTGQYPAGAKDRLDASIDAAAAVRDDVNATGAQVLQAIAYLDAAVAKFQGLIITASTGDINNSGGISLGDLAIIADCYGNTSADPGWDEIKHMDINGDAEIGLYELAFIARRMILD